MGRNMNTHIKKTTVFVSSTCYDLMQIREDICRFIEKELGYEAMLSEKDVFPIRSEFNAIENCIQIVKQQAELFILIIGGRYGQLVGDTEKSITNLEYETARRKGIPVYIFVEENILTMLPVWEKNQNADFSNVVDSNKVFEFVTSLKNDKKNWIFRFKKAQDIIESVRYQFAFLMNEGLALKRKFLENELTEKVLKYSGRVFHVAVEKPLGWEYLLFVEALAYNLQQQQDLKYDLLYGMYLNESVLLEESEAVIKLCKRKLNELQYKVNLLMALMNQGFKEAIGKPGEPGNPDYILYIAERVIDIYKGVVSWSLDFKKYMVPEEFHRLLDLMAKWGSSVINGIESFIPMAREKIRLALAQNKKETVTLTMQIELDEELTIKVKKEFNHLAVLLGKK